jgi:hypothetical protein
LTGYFNVLFPAGPHQGWEGAADEVLGLDHGTTAAAREPEVDTLILPGLEAFEHDPELGLQQVAHQLFEIQRRERPEVVQRWGQSLWR